MGKETIFLAVEEMILGARKGSKWWPVEKDRRRASKHLLARAVYFYKQRAHRRYAYTKQRHNDGQFILPASSTC